MPMPFHEQQLHFMMEMCAYRTAYLNPFFHLLHYVDSIYFAFILIPLVSLTISYKWGIRLFFVFFFSMLINHALKIYFGWPRPCTDLPELGLYPLNTFGFPSNASQNAALLGGLVAYYWKSRYAPFLGAFFALLIGFSRVYLGVHYPIDVLGGWTLGLIVLAVFIQVIDPIENFLKKFSA